MSGEGPAGRLPRKALALWTFPKRPRAPPGLPCEGRGRPRPPLGPHSPAAPPQPRSEASSEDPRALASGHGSPPPAAVPPRPHSQVRGEGERAYPAAILSPWACKVFRRLASPPRPARSARRAPLADTHPGRPAQLGRSRASRRERGGAAAGEPRDPSRAARRRWRPRAPAARAQAQPCSRRGAAEAGGRCSCFWKAALFPRLRRHCRLWPHSPLCHIQCLLSACRVTTVSPTVEGPRGPPHKHLDLWKRVKKPRRTTPITPSLGHKAVFGPSCVPGLEGSE